jgi:ribosome maturation factor RimP
MGPLLFYLRDGVMVLTETWLQQIIRRELDDVELVLLEQFGGKQQKMVRLYIDHRDGVTHDLCSRVSEVVGRALDDVDAIGGPYTLEVSSPGLERPLRKREHYQAQVGKKVHVKTRVPVEGRKVWQGRLAEVGVEEIVIEGEGRRVHIDLSDVTSAHLIYEFG